MHPTWPGVSSGQGSADHRIKGLAEVFLYLQPYDSVLVVVLAVLIYFLFRCGCESFG